MDKSTNPRTLLLSVRRHLFLSPHYDDIALSAGATVAQLADAGMHPESVVVFGAEPNPDEPLSPFATAMHAGWGLPASEVIASRQAEEAAAAAILGASREVLPFHDAIYRGHAYLSDDQLFSSPAAADQPLPGAISAALDLDFRRKTDVRLYAPLGIGNHVDHQLVFQAAADLARNGWDVWFYEDIPYALKPEARSSRMEAIGIKGIEPVATLPAESGWERKIDAVLCYPSQLETIFRHYVGVGTERGEIASALARYARAIGNGTVAERFWQVKESSRQPGS